MSRNLAPHFQLTFKQLQYFWSEDWQKRWLSGFTRFSSLEKKSFFFLRFENVESIPCTTWLLIRSSLAQKPKDRPSFHHLLIWVCFSALCWQLICLIIFIVLGLSQWRFFHVRGFDYCRWQCYWIVQTWEIPLQSHQNKERSTSLWSRYLSLKA